MAIGSIAGCGRVGFFDRGAPTDLTNDTDGAGADDDAADDGATDGAGADAGPGDGAVADPGDDGDADGADADTAPVVAWAPPTPAEGSAVEASVSVAGTCEAGLSVFFGGAITAPATVPCADGTFAADVTLSGADGPITITASQTSAHGQTASVTRALQLDTHSPTLAWAWCTPAEGVRVGPEVEVSLGCESGARIRLSIDAVATDLGACPLSAILKTTLTLSGGAGPKVVAVTATDAAGNVTGLSRNWSYDPAIVTRCNFVLGQPDFTSNTAGSGNAAVMSGPRGVILVGAGIALADNGNHRILMWTSLPTSFLQAADLVLGQPDFASSAANAGGTASARTLQEPGGIATDGVHFIVADTANHRVLIWNHLPLDPASDMQAPADVVCGQPDFASTTDNNGGISAHSLSLPRAVAIAAGKLIVSDFGNNRVLVWSAIPTTNGASANLVLGQASFTSGSSNRGGSAAANTLSNNYAIWSDGTTLAVADVGNSRVLIWNSFPSSNGQAASVVLGQTTMSGDQANAGGSPSASSMSGPRGVSFAAGRFTVSDAVNNRVMIWNGIPSSNNAAADFIYGQPDATTVAPGVAMNRLDGPRHLLESDGWVFVSDTDNNRVLLLESLYFTSGE